MKTLFIILWQIVGLVVIFSFPETQNIIFVISFEAIGALLYFYFFKSVKAAEPDTEKENKRPSYLDAPKTGSSTPIVNHPIDNPWMPIKAIRESIPPFDYTTPEAAPPSKMAYANKTGSGKVSGTTKSKKVINIKVSDGDDALKVDKRVKDKIKKMAATKTTKKAIPKTKTKKSAPKSGGKKRK